MGEDLREMLVVDWSEHNIFTCWVCDVWHKMYSATIDPILCSVSMRDAVYYSCSPVFCIQKDNWITGWQDALLLPPPGDGSARFVIWGIICINGELVKLWHSTVGDVWHATPLLITGPHHTWHVTRWRDISRYNWHQSPHQTAAL